jgi:hypothetical protein
MHAPPGGGLHHFLTILIPHDRHLPLGASGRDSPGDVCDHVGALGHGDRDGDTGDRRQRGPGVQSEGVQAAAEQLLATSAERYLLTAAATARQGTALDLTYRVCARSGYSPAVIVAELNALDAVESVDMLRDG